METDSNAHGLDFSHWYLQDDSLDRFSIVSAQRLMETLQAIDEQGSAAERWPRGPRMNSALLAIFASLMGMAMDPGAKVRKNLNH